jgi:large subunit ribosomal protein L4
MELQVKNIEGKAVKKIQVPDNIYGLEMNEHVLHSAVKAYRANRRQGTHSTKTDSYVSGGGKKPFKQKGTGNARQGSTRSALNPGGATHFGPLPRKYRESTNRKMLQLALKIALSEKVRHNKLIVVDDFSMAKHSTKHVVKVMSTLGAERATISDERKDDMLYKSTRNIHGAQAVQPSELTAEQVLRFENLIISENALNTLHQRFEENKNASL